MNNPYAPHCNIHELKMHNPAPRPEHCLLLLHTSSSHLSLQLRSDASSQISDLPQSCISADAGFTIHSCPATIKQNQKPATSVKLD